MWYDENHSYNYNRPRFSLGIYDIIKLAFKKR